MGTEIDLTNRRAIVTGGASGLGLATVERFLSSGATVAVWDRSPAALEKLQDSVSNPEQLSGFEVDVADRSSVRVAAQRSIEWLGGLDILVNSAGVALGRVRIEEYPFEAWDKEIGVNLTGTFNVCRQLVPALVENGYGRIVNVASVSAKDGNPNQCGYVASKGGVIALTKSMAAELADRGVLVNSITPTAFDTPMFRAWESAGDRAVEIRNKIPLGRLGLPGEVAAMITWMCSDECSFTTGQAFDISGGRASY
ncbi:SDR family NAD(P)-dependent oxidoreductase [Streptomyces sp. NPDC058045]|uniref:SDR family NAD(P)-dependent oxidoreductase n=1 Tax=Streptomyces sp. NPDC058045 TaxID=3346311 RepID=UPI0036E4D890